MKTHTLYIAVLAFLFCADISAQIAVNTSGAQPDPSAILDITSLDKGILIPRMSTGARLAIVSPAKGLMVYDEDLDAFCFFNGSQWINNNRDEIQQLAVSLSNDTLFITDGNYVIIPGLSSSNSGTLFANAGPDVVNSCQTSIGLNGSQAPADASVLWSIISGTGGSIDQPTSRNTTFRGLEGVSYELEYKVTFSDFSEAFDRKLISIATYTTASVANAGPDQLEISSTSTTLEGNLPGAGSQGRWIIQSGINGLLTDATDPQTIFTGEKGQIYILRWEHYNACSSSSDQVTVSISPTAQGEVSSTGRYFIPDERFRAYLTAVYPSIMDGDSLIVAQAINIKNIDIQNLDVRNLDGLRFFTALSYLNVSSNGNLKVLPYFSSVLKQFISPSSTSLEIIPSFPSSLDTIILYGGSLQVEISDFPPNLKYLSFDRYYNGDVPFIPNSCKYVRIWNIYNNSNILNIPEQCHTFIHTESPTNEFPSFPADKSNLQRLQLDRTSVSSLPSMCEFTNLTFLNLNNNAILELGALPIGLEELSISNNPLVCVSNKPPGVLNVLQSYPICVEAVSCENAVSSTGKYYILDDRFRSYLQIAYPGIMDGDSLIVALAPSATTININNLGATNLDGLRYFTGLQYLNCSNNKITVIPFFSEVLRRFECENCYELFSIPLFPQSLDTINLRIGGNFRPMPEFPSQLKYLTITGYSQTSFPQIPETCEYVILENFYNYSGLINIPSAAKEFIMYGCDKQINFPIVPADKSKLERLLLWDNSLASMPSLYEFINLYELSLGSNTLLKLELLPEGLLELRIDNNPIICVENKPIGVADVLAGYEICPE